MAEVETTYNLRSLLCTRERDFLIRNNGEKVKVEKLKGKIVGLYFSPHSCPERWAFCHLLSFVYSRLEKKGDFEIVFLSDDEDEQSFKEYPGLALPLSDTSTKEKLDQEFDVKGIHTLIFLDQKCKITSTDGVRIIRAHCSDAYPFSKERLAELEAQKEAQKEAREEAIRRDSAIREAFERNVHLYALWNSSGPDFLIGNGGRKVPISELEDRTVCFYFSDHLRPTCRGFTSELILCYNDLKRRNEDLEIVVISRVEGRQLGRRLGPRLGLTRPHDWLSLPHPRGCQRCFTDFEIESTPTLIVLGPDGNILQRDGVGIIRDYGSEAYPFSEERVAELRAEREAIRLSVVW